MAIFDYNQIKLSQAENILLKAEPNIKEINTATSTISSTTTPKTTPEIINIENKTPDLPPDQTSTSTVSLNVPILVYHSVHPAEKNETDLMKEFNVTPETFEKQLAFLKENSYTVISFDDYISALKNEKTLPEKSVMINFDDGWKNQYDYAFPILKKYNDTATFFIETNFINHHGFLSLDEIKELRDTGMTIGAHTKNHPKLSTITDQNILDDEIAGSKKVLENDLGQPVKYLAYPYGLYNDQVIETTKKAGFLAGRSFTGGKHNTTDNLFNLKTVTATEDMIHFSKELNKK